MNSKNQIIIYENYAEILLYNKENNLVGKSMIDIEDIDKIKDLKWYFDAHGGYVVSSKCRRQIKLHRFVMDCPQEFCIDHLFHNKLDNRKCNLKIVTIQQNNLNTGVQSNNKSGFRGVFWDKKRNRWLANLRINKSNVHLGYFININDAIKVRKQAENEYFKPILDLKVCV